MRIIHKTHRTVAEQRQSEYMHAQLEKQQATIEYVAAMAGVDLPIDETENKETEEE